MTTFKITDRSFSTLSLSSYEWNLWANYWMVDPFAKTNHARACVCVCGGGARGKGGREGYTDFTWDLTWLRLKAESLIIACKAFPVFLFSLFCLTSCNIPLCSQLHSHGKLFIPRWPCSFPLEGLCASFSYAENALPLHPLTLAKLILT